MVSLKQKIESFRRSQASVYSTQPTRIVRDARAARRSAKDHAGRWFFELVQNCDDAKATTVEVRITDKAVYVSDDGVGFLPKAVEAISGTDFSDKPVGTIGRKGVGFKAVYEITSAPQVFTLDDQGLEFNLDRAEQWFRQQGLRCNKGEMPYQWLPFFISRSEAEGEDPVLREVRAFETVIRLPLRSGNCRDVALNHLAEWAPYALLPFNYVKTLRVRSDELCFDIGVVRNEDLWTLRDSRNAGEVKWKVFRRPETPPPDILAKLDPDDQERVQNVGFLIAAPVGEDGTVSPTDGFLPLHVFYPTEEPSPVSLLLHAEFLVKSDRTAIIPIEHSDFNSWVADILADLVVVNFRTF